MESSTSKVPNLNKPSNSHHNLVSEDFNNSSNLPSYRLQVLQQPIHARLCSFKEKVDKRPVDPPPIIQLLSTDRKEYELGLNSHLFLHARLVHPETLMELRSDSGARCTAGTVVQSPHKMKDLEGNPAVYFAFPDLSLRIEGHYKLKFVLYELLEEGVTEVCSIFSDTFQVLSPKLFPGMNESTLLTKHIAEGGFKLRVRKKNRSGTNQKRSGANSETIQIMTSSSNSSRFERQDSQFFFEGDRVIPPSMTRRRVSLGQTQFDVQGIGKRGSKRKESGGSAEGLGLGLGTPSSSSSKGIGSGVVGQVEEVGIGGNEGVMAKRKPGRPPKKRVKIGDSPNSSGSSTASPLDYNNNSNQVLYHSNSEGYSSEWSGRNCQPSSTESYYTSYPMGSGAVEAVEDFGINRQLRAVTSSISKMNSNSQVQPYSSHNFEDPQYHQRHWRGQGSSQHASTSTIPSSHSNSLPVYSSGSSRFASSSMTSERQISNEEYFSHVHSGNNKTPSPTSTSASSVNHYRDNSSSTSRYPLSGRNEWNGNQATSGSGGSGLSNRRLGANSFIPTSNARGNSHSSNSSSGGGGMGISKNFLPTSNFPSSQFPPIRSITSGTNSYPSQDDDQPRNYGAPNPNGEVSPMNHTSSCSHDVSNSNNRIPFNQLPPLNVSNRQVTQLPPLSRLLPPPTMSNRFQHHGASTDIYFNSNSSSFSNSM